ncbi:MAG: four helix bundle protein [Saprospiraceae bacterium]|nr:four helix bundle protein [Saprospiraceae bacterium]
MFNDDLKKKSFEFTLDLIKFLRLIPESQESSIIKRQLIRSSSSISANFRASCVSRSQQEWYSKICIVIEEVDETRYWLELMKELYPPHTEKITFYLNQSEELIKIFGKARGKINKKE